MYETLLRLYKSEMIDETKLENAVIKGWITEGQKQTIMS
ncbi:XkdX family protein [Clostridium sp. DL1XJH146]